MVSSVTVYHKQYTQTCQYPLAASLESIKEYTYPVSHEASAAKARELRGAAERGPATERAASKRRSSPVSDARATGRSSPGPSWFADLRSQGARFLFELDELRAHRLAGNPYNGRIRGSDRGTSSRARRARAEVATDRKFRFLADVERAALAHGSRVA